MAIYEMPMTAKPQRFSIALSGVTYQLTVKWNVAAQCWILDIADEFGVPIVSGIPVVTGADLLGQYEYLNFGGKLFVRTDGNDLPPGFKNLGITSKVYWVTVDG